MTKRHIIVAVLAISTLAAWPLSAKSKSHSKWRGPAKGESQSEMNEQACEKFKKADSKLNAVYTQVLEKHKDDAAFLSKFKKAQRAWLAFRDAHLEAIYPAKDKNEYGSVFGMCNCMELTALTDERTDDLSRWLNTEEGDVCAGTRL